MTIDTSTMISITEADQNDSKAAKVVEEFIPAQASGNIGQKGIIQWMMERQQ